MAVINEEVVARLNNANNQSAQQRQQISGNPPPGNFLTNLEEAFVDQNLKDEFVAIMKINNTETQVAAIKDFIQKLPDHANFHNEPKIAHMLLIELSKENHVLFDQLKQYGLAQTKNIEYGNATTRQNISLLFEQAAHSRLLKNAAMLKKIQEALFERNGDIKQHFVGTNDEVMNGVFSLAKAVYESKKMHAAYSELKWPAFMLWGALFRFIVSTLAEKDPEYSVLLKEPEPKTNQNNVAFLK